MASYFFMRDSILLYVNGHRHLVGGQSALRSLSDFLRRDLGLIGTKIVCSEGDCGACTVLIGRPRDGRFVYQSVDSCIQFMFQLDGMHIVSVEGLSRNDQMTPMQQSMIDCHGSQCGFCTPGFVVAMTGMLEDCQQLSTADLRHGLTGNLCRCTGYTPILDAGTQFDASAHHRLKEIYPEAAMLEDLAENAAGDIEIITGSGSQKHSLFSPDDLNSATKFLDAHPEATIIAGGTDVGVRINKTLELPTSILDLNRLTEMESVSVESDRLVLGARASWAAVEEACAGVAPEFHRILTVFGSPQIRNVGTIGGNIVNASPIADSLPFLYVMESMLTLSSQSGTRRVNINDFYSGYKKFDLRPGELLTKIDVPLPRDDETLKLYKVSRRRDLDIASFTAAIRLRFDGNTIAEASIALGAVGPTIVRPRKVEQFLLGKPFSEATMRQAGELATEEISPISDVRGSAEYRTQLTRNVFLKFFYENQPELLIA